MRTVSLFLFMLLQCVPGYAQDEPRASLPDWKFERAMALEAVPEPSGLCYYPPRQSLFIVDDGAQDRLAAVYEIDFQGQVLQKREIGFDLEGVCFCPADGLIYVADESEERLYLLDPGDLGLVRTVRISRSMSGEEKLKAGGNGFEGIEYIPDGFGEWSDSIVLLNQDDPHALLAVRRSDMIAEEEGETEAFGFLGIAAINAGSLLFDAGTGELWVVHSWMNVMEMLDIRSLEVLRWEVVPGAAQEAVAIDGDGRLWIGSDSGGLAVYTAAE